MSPTLTLTAALTPLAAEQGFDLTPLAIAEQRWDAGMAALMARDFAAFDRIMNFKPTAQDTGQDNSEGDAA